jgi:hypothetical protein
VLLKTCSVSGLTVTVLDTTHLQHSLGSGSGDDTGTSGYTVSIEPDQIAAREHTGRDKSAHDGTGLSRDLARDSVRLGNVRTPVTSSNGNDGELGVDNGTSDGTGDFLGTLHTETDVSACQQSSVGGIGSRGRTVLGNSVH